MADKDEKEIEQTTTASVQEMRATIAELDSKIARLTDLFVEQDIERNEYLERKRKLMSQKRSAQENILRLERNAGHWIEPMREWTKDAQTMREIAQSEDLPLKKSSLQKIFGSNLTLCAREARGTPKPHWFSLVRGKENQCENNLVSTMVGDEGLEPPTFSV